MEWNGLKCSFCKKQFRYWDLKILKGGGHPQAVVSSISVISFHHSQVWQELLWSGFLHGRNESAHAHV